MSLLPPLLLHYYITERCNCKCSFCDIWKKKPEIPFADPLHVKQNLKDAKKLGIKFVDFTGGEPLLHPNLPDLLQSARQLKFKTSVTTNCLLYPRQAEKLAGLITYLHFSIDAMDADLHNEIRGNMTFNSVVQSIDIAKKLGEKPDLLYTVTQKNFGELEALAQFAHRQKLMLIVNPVFSHTSPHDLGDNTLEYIESFRHRPFVYVNTAFHLLHENGGNQIHQPRCRVMDSTVVISPQNELLLPCYHFAMRRIPLKSNLRQILRSDDWKNFRQKQGRFCFCDKCTMNCYFDPSFFYKADAYFFKSISAKAKYVWDKYIRP